MMTHNTSTCTWCNGEMDAALAHDAVVRVVGRPEKANFAPAGSSGQATADFPKPTEMVYMDGRILRPPEGQEHYVDSEDENIGVMMLANKTENAAARTANTAERKIALDKTHTCTMGADGIY